MRNVSLMLMLGTILYPWKPEAACVTPPSCEELGFTADASKCSGSFLRCPWDLNKAACMQQTPLPILYGDGTVAKGIISGKTPIGVVFDETNKLAVALTNVTDYGSAGSETTRWSNEYYDIPSLTNCAGDDSISTVAAESCDVDGRANTDKILACGSNCGGTPAATAANSYEAAGCTKDFCKKTKWFLPSLRDLVNIYKIKDQIEASLTLLNSFGAISLASNWYWSSTERDFFNAWTLGMGNGYRYHLYKDNHDYPYVRPVVKY